MLSVAQTFRSLAVIHMTARALRNTGNEIDLHLAARCAALEAEILQKAVDEGLDTELFMDDLPEEFPPPGTPEEEALETPGEEELEQETGQEVDEEMLEDLGRLECVECLDTPEAPLGYPTDPSLTGPSSLTTTPFVPMSGARKRPKAEGDGGSFPKPKRAKRKYLACAEPTLARMKDGRKVWMSVCAYQQPPSKRVRMISKIVSTNSAFRPRHVAFGGRKLTFTTEADIDRILGD